jgi:hypothetical protein
MHGKSIVEVDSEQWTIHSPHQIYLEKGNLPSAPPQPNSKGKRTRHLECMLGPSY